MDMKINGLGFKGKNEILYGLNNAANATHSYSVYRQPRLMQYGENKNLVKYEAYARAYLDMAIMDSHFSECVEKFSSKDLDVAKKYLQPFTIGVHKENPMEYFKKFIESVTTKEHSNSKKKNALTLLLTKLEIL